MKFYNVFKANNKKIDLDSFSKLFSEDNELLTWRNSEYFCVRFEAEKYLLNQRKIAHEMQSLSIKGLILTNYKFINLFIELQKYDDLSVKKVDLSDDVFSTIDEDFKDFLEKCMNNSIEKTLNYMESELKKIRYVEIKVCNHRNRISISSSGLIGINDAYPIDKNKYIIDVIEMLHGGEKK